MAQWLVLIGLFIKSYGSSIPVTLASIPIYLYFIFLCRKVWQQPEKLDAITFDPKVTLWAFIILIDQLIMIGVSYATTDHPDFTRGIMNSSVNTVAYFGSAFLIYYLLVVLLDSQEQILKFVQGTIKTFVGFTILVLLPQVIATVSPILNGWVNLVGKLFESKHFGRDDFYSMGSYTTTLHRVNGFSSEASFLAVLLAVVFIPLILAAIRYNFSYFKNRVERTTTKFYWVLLVASFLVLFFAKTTTGILVIIFAGLILLVRLESKRRKQLFLFALLACCFVGLLYLTVPYIQNLLDSFLFKKQGTSNRLGGTIGLLLTFLHYPITGVGDGFTSFYNFKFVPLSTTHNWEYQAIFQQSGYPIQSIWGGWLAGYGLIGIGPILIFIYHKCKQAVTLYQKIDLRHDTQLTLYQVLIESFFYSLIMLFILALFTFSWSDSIYLVIFFFYIVMIKFVGSQLQNEH
ncbi:O-antigen ligase family protein [Loigolactobacillus jiayinensis]|uniref:O-antigen ligase family protein n=1 Tax=Loigolactobacillus jiayinensis TaxID=2486016 RepID=A0ABW1RB96_9LACO|nr:hypothetical protein [Loigolactobacillus jiayinensis]